MDFEEEENMYLCDLLENKDSDFIIIQVNPVVSKQLCKKKF